MKTKLLILISSVACMASANAQLLVAGWDGVTPYNVPLSSASVDVTATLQASNTTNDVQGWAGGPAKPLWGTTDLDVDPVDDGTTLFGNNDTTVNNPFNVDLTFTLELTNNAAADLELKQFHFIASRDTGDAATDALITYTAGDLTGTNSGNIDLTAGSGYTGYDIDLSSFMSDTILSTGESATFVWSMSGRTTGPGTNPSIRLDNFAISAVPEASTFALIGLASIALLRRRR